MPNTRQILHFTGVFILLQATAGTLGNDQNPNLSLIRNGRDMYNGNRYGSYGNGSLNRPYGNRNYEGSDYRNRDSYGSFGNRDYGQDSYSGDYGRGRYGSNNDRYGPGSYGNRYEEGRGQCPYCNKCEKCQNDEPATTTTAPAPDPTAYNPCLNPSLPANCTADQCQATLNAGLTAQIFPSTSRFSISRCALENYGSSTYLILGVLNVCLVPGLDENLNYGELNCVPTISPFSGCFRGGYDGTIYVYDDNAANCTTRIDAPVLLSCEYYIYTTNVVVLAQSLVEIEILPDPAPCDPVVDLSAGLEAAAVIQGTSVGAKQILVRPLPPPELI